MNISDEELDELLEHAAERGAEKAIEKMTNDIYQAVGKKVINKFWQLLGMVAVGLAVWALKQGWFNS